MPILRIAAALALTAGWAMVPAQITGWELPQDNPDTAPCRAVKVGPSADIQILRNRAGKFILVAGHSDWSYNGEPFPFTITIDGGAPVTLTGYPLDRVILAMVEDESVERQLRTGHLLEGTLPDRHFQAEIDGLGKAYDAVAVCPG